MCVSLANLVEKKKKALHKVWLVTLCLELQEFSSLSVKDTISKAEILAFLK